LDCLRYLYQLAPRDALYGVSTAISTSTLTDFFTENEILRILLIGFDYDATAMRVRALRHAPAEKFSKVKQSYANGTDSYGEGHGLYSVLGTELSVFRATPSANQLVYCAVVAPPEWSGDDLTIPAGWEGLISSYCAIQAKMKDEEPEVAIQLYKSYQQELSRFRDFRDAVKVGG
jgi:hypothetical protein